MSQASEQFKSLVLVPHHGIIESLKTLLLSQDSKPEGVGRMIMLDPVIMLEILRAALEESEAASESLQIPSPDQMLAFLGTEKVLSILNQLAQNMLKASPRLTDVLDQTRFTCWRIAQVARILASSVDTRLGDQLMVIALFVRFGELIGALHFKERYAAAAEQASTRFKFLSQLSRDFSFDAERACIRYLGACNVPEKIIACLDRDSRVTENELLTRKLIVQSSIELFNAYEEKKLDKYAPGKPPPPRSSVPPLHLSDPVYARTMTDIRTFLESAGNSRECIMKDLTSFQGPESALHIEAGDPESAETEEGAEIQKPALSASRIARIERTRQQFSAPSSKTQPQAGAFKPNLLIANAIRGLRNSIAIFDRQSAASLRKTMLKILTPFIDSTPAYAHGLIGAAKSYHADFLADTDPDNLEENFAALTPDEVPAVFALTYLARELGQACNPDEWRHLFRALRLHVDIGWLLGSHLPKLGAGNSMLLAGTRFFALAILLIQDATKFREYREHLQSSGQIFDCSFEEEKWKQDHLILGGLLLQGLGVGVKIARVLPAVHYPEGTSDPDIKYSAHAVQLMEILQRSGSISDSSSLLPTLQISKQDGFDIQDKLGPLLSEAECCRWLLEAAGIFTQSNKENSE